MIAWLTRFSIRTRTLLLVTAGLAVILAALGYLSTQALRESTAHVFDERLRLAQVAVHHIDDYVQEALALLERAAASEGFDLTDADPEPERRALRELLAAGLFTHEVFVTDRQGRMLWTEPPVPAMMGVDLSAESEVRQALQTGEPQVSRLVRFHEAEKAKVTFVVPIKDPQGAVVGIIGGAADPTSPFFTSILSALRPAGAGHVDLLDRDGMVLASSDPAHALKESGHKTCLEPMFREEKATVGIYPHIEAGVEKWKDVIAFAPLSAAPWGVSIEQPEAEALTPVYHLRQRLILLGALALLITVVLTRVSTQAVLDPLGQVLAASRRITSGDLETPVPPLGRDEVGELGRGFEAMRRRLQQREQILAAWGEELETAVRERTRELSALYAIDRVAAQSLDLEEILRDSLDKVLEVLEIEAGGILLLEPDGETMTLRAHRGLSEEFVRAVQRIKVGEGISGRAVAEGQTAVLDVADGSTELAEVYPTERLASFAIKEGFQSLVSTPLASKGAALGALTLGTRRQRAFPPEEMELLAAIGRQLGGAVENARLFEAERRRAAQLALVADIARRAAAILDSDRLLQETADALQRTFGYYDVVLFLVDQEAGELILKARAGAFERPFPQEPGWKVGDVGIVDWVARHGETLLANDVGREPRYRPFLPGTRSELCVPIKDGEQVVAGINVESDRLYAFDKADVVAMEALADELAVALRNAQLFAERQRKITELAALNQIGRALAATLRLDELLEIIHREVTTVMEADAFFIALYDRQTDQMDYRIRVDMEVREPQERRPPAGLTGLIVSSGEPILIRDFEREKDQYPQVKLWGSMEAPASWLGVPMVVSEQVVGVISVQAYRPAAYDDGHLALLSTIAAQAALAAENARLYAEASKRADQMAIVHTLGRQIIPLLDVDELLQTAAEALHQRFGYLSVQLYLLDREAGEIEARGVAGEEGIVVRGYRQKIGEGITGRAAERGERVLIGDVSQEPDFIPCVPGVQSELVLPIRVGDEVAGVLNIESDQFHGFDGADVVALEALARQIGVALENAQLYEAEVRRARQLTLVGDIARRAVAMLDPDALLWETARAIQTAFGYPDVLIFLVDHEGRQIIRKAWAGQYERDTTTDLPKPIEERGILNWVATHGETVLVNDVRRDPRYVPFYTQTAAELCVPLKDGETVLGGINVESEKLNAFDQSDVLALETLTDNLVVALRNARLYQETQQRLAELSALSEVSGAVRGAATVEEMLPIILDKTLEVVAAKAGAIFLVDQVAQQVVVPVARGPMEEVLVDRSFPLAGSVAEAMLHTGGPDISPDLAADPRMPAEMRAMLRGGESGIGLPLRAAGVPVGMLAVSWLAPHVVSDDELRLLTAIADMAASAVHRAGLHDQTARQARELARLVAELEETYDATLAALSATLDARDHDTEGHSRRVTQLAMTIARAMGLPESEIEALMRGALLHDIGKIGVPDSILRKPGSLIDEERAQMQRHNQIGYDMLKDIRFLAPALPVVLCHHERWDGTGYPQGLRGEAIPLVARIFAVADAYDAMTSNRPYRRAMSHAEAIAEIQREAGKQFDPQVVEVFLAGL